MAGGGLGVDMFGSGIAKTLDQSVTAGVAEPLMPQVLGDGNEVVVFVGRGDGVHVTVRVTSKDHHPCAPVLNRKATMVKSYVNRIVMTKSFNRD